MKVHGTSTLEAPRELVFTSICDPRMLMAVIPGCEGVEQVSPTEYRGRISLRLPGIVGSYRTLVELVESVPPARVELEGRVEGALGSIQGRAELRLTDAGGSTVIDYAGQAVIDGPLARLDSRFVESLAGSLIGQGLRSLSEQLARGLADRVVAASPEPSKGTSA